MKKHVLLLSIFTLLLLQVAAQAQIITTVAGTGSSGFYGEGIPATDANIMGVRGVALDKLGNLYFVDGSNYRIRKIGVDGIITTVAGNGSSVFSGDGGMATDAGLTPFNVTLDDDGNLYVSGNNRVRKITTSGVITTIAGTGEHSYNGDNIPATAAKIWGPDGLVFDKNGNLYIADAGNSRVRKVSISGIITTVAGNGIDGYNGDNILAVDAQVGSPSALAIDISNNLYFGDQGNYRIRKIDRHGYISTIGGTGLIGYDGDNGLATEAKLRRIGGIAVDKNGNLLFSDPFYHCVRRIDQSGIISTIAGTGIVGFSGDGGNAILARINSPHGLAIDEIGGLYIADFGNKRIRYVNNVVSVPEIGTNKDCILVYPNPSNGNFYIDFPSFKSAQVLITDILGNTVNYEESINSGNCAVNTDLPSGVYFVRVIDGQQTCTQKIYTHK